jgi:hypothetical protein
MRTFYSNEPLTNNRLQALAPSIFASDHKAGLSSKYVFVPTSEIVKEMEHEGWLPVIAKESRVRDESNSGYQKHLIRFRNFNEQLKDKLEVNDTILEIVLTNSHNGTSSFVFNCGMYRCVCSNQMMVSESAFDAIRVRHSGYDASQVLGVAGEVIQKAPVMINRIKELQTIELTPDEKYIFGQAAKQLRFEKPEVVQTEQVLRPNRITDTGNDLWKTFNVVQENLTKGKVSYVDKDQYGRRVHKSTREVKSIDGGMKLNQALFTLTEKMAELKKMQ